MKLQVGNLKLSEDQSRRLFNQMEEYYPEVNGTGQFDYEGDFTPEIAQEALIGAAYQVTENMIKVI